MENYWIELHFVDKNTSAGEVKTSGYFLKWIVIDKDGTEGQRAASSIWRTKSTALKYARLMTPKGWKAYDFTGKKWKPISRLTFHVSR